MTTAIAWVQDRAGHRGESANPFYAVLKDGGGRDVDWRGWHCERMSAGCAHCFSEAQNINRRFNMGTSLPFKLPAPAFKDGLTFHLDEEMLRRWTTARVPKAVFACSMTDWAGEWWPDEFRDKMFAAMGLSKHRFYLLTKRPKEMWRYMSGETRDTARMVADAHPLAMFFDADVHWPPPQVSLGVSVEDQKTADERIPILLDTPAAHRFVSLEPLLERVNLWPYLPGLNWAVVGAESGPRRRPCELEWIRFVVAQCREAGIPAFVKQVSLNGRVSHNPVEWPEDCRVQEVP